MLNVGRAEGLDGRVTGFRFWIVSRERKNKKPLEKRSLVPKVDIDRKKNPPKPPLKGAPPAGT